MVIKAGWVIHDSDETERRKQAHGEFYAATMGEDPGYVLKRIVRESVNTEFLAEKYPLDTNVHKWHIKIEITEV